MHDPLWEGEAMKEHIYTVIARNLCDGSLLFYRVTATSYQMAEERVLRKIQRKMAKPYLYHVENMRVSGQKTWRTCSPPNDTWRVVGTITASVPMTR